MKARDAWFPMDRNLSVSDRRRVRSAPSEVTVNVELLQAVIVDDSDNNSNVSAPEKRWSERKL